MKNPGQTIIMSGTLFFFLIFTVFSIFVLSMAPVEAGNLPSIYSVRDQGINASSSSSGSNCLTDSLILIQTSPVRYTYFEFDIPAMDASRIASATVKISLDLSDPAHATSIINSIADPANGVIHLLKLPPGWEWPANMTYSNSSTDSANFYNGDPINTYLSTVVNASDDSLFVAKRGERVWNATEHSLAYNITDDIQNLLTASGSGVTKLKFIAKAEGSTRPISICASEHADEAKRPVLNITTTYTEPEIVGVHLIKSGNTFRITSDIVNDNCSAGKVIVGIYRNDNNSLEMLEVLELATTGAYQVNGGNGFTLDNYDPTKQYYAKVFMWKDMDTIEPWNTFVQSTSQ